MAAAGWRGVEDQEDSGWTSIKVPRAMAERIDRLVAVKEEGHASRSSYALSKIREGLDADEEKLMRRAGFLAWLEERSQLNPLRSKARR